MFTEYLYLPKIWARPSRYGTQLFGSLLPLHCKYPPLMYSATPSPVSAKKTTPNKPLLKRTFFDVRGLENQSKHVKARVVALPPWGSGRGAQRPSPLERVATPSLFPHRTPVVCVYVYWNTATSTTDLSGWDLHHSYPTCRHFPRSNENKCPCSDLYVSVRSSFIDNSSKLETAQTFINKWSDRQIAVDPHKRTLFNKLKVNSWYIYLQGWSKSKWFWCMNNHPKVVPLCCELQTPMGEKMTGLP